MNRRVAWALAVVLVAAGCGGSESSDSSSPDPEPKSTSTSKRAAGANGPIVLVDSEGALSVVDPAGEGARPIQAPGIDTGAWSSALLAPGLAFFETDDGGLLLVDAIAGTAEVIWEEVGSFDDPLQLGGGKRFALFTGEVDTEGIIVDLTTHRSRPLRDLITADDADPENYSAAGFARISPDERFLAIEDGNDVRFYTLEGGTELTQIGARTPGRFNGFTADGKSAYVSEGLAGPDEPPRSRLRRLMFDEGGMEAAPVEVDGGVVGVVGGSALLLQGAEESPHYSLVGDDGQLRPLDLSLSAGDKGIGVVPTATAGHAVFGVSSSEDGASARWGVVEEGGQVRSFDDLNGFQRLRSGRDFVFLTDIGALLTGEGERKGSLAVIDVEAGSRQKTKFDSEGHELISQGASLSPDGSRAAVTSRDDPPLTWLVPLDGAKVTEIKGSFGKWSPDGTQLIGFRLEGDTAHIVIRAVGDGKERDLGPASDAIWTPAAAG